MSIQLEEICKKRCVGRGSELPCPLLTHHSPRTSTGSATRKLSRPHSLGTAMEASPLRCDPPLPQAPAPPPSPPGRWEMGLEVPSFQSWLGLPGDQLPSRISPGPHPASFTKDTPITTHPGNSRRFRNSASGTRVKD